jgi:carbon storage regulator
MAYSEHEFSCPFLFSNHKGGKQMLILSRKVGESLIIDGNIEVKILDIKNGNVRVGVHAPDHIVVDRQEIHERKTDLDLNHHTTHKE